MKQIILIIISAILSVPILFFIMYAFLGFIDWMFSDPFDWITDFTPKAFQESNDIVRCREIGGFPKTSAWNGRLLECNLVGN